MRLISTRTRTLCFSSTNSDSGSFSQQFFKKLLVLTWIQLWVTPGKFTASANFNLFLDRREFQKLHGISSDIYYVREGVVNEYALNFVVTVPPEVDNLHFSWQSLTKRTVHYDMVMEYADVLALSPPISNITNSGRVPQSLETFKVTLLCTGRSNAEVGVTIRMNFQVKHPKLNTTSINIKRNKICLFNDMSTKTKLSEGSLPDGLFPSGAEKTSLNPKPHFPIANNTTLLFQDTAPSLLLAGLLGGCGFTASLVFLIFFICLRRKLTLPGSSGPQVPHYNLNNGNDQNSSSNNSSPACLLRQAQGTESDNQKIWNHFNNAEKCHGGSGTILPRSGSHNSYVTIASFWNDIFSPGTGSGANNPKTTQFQTTTHQDQKFHSNSNSLLNSSRVAGSDVSPYAYAHVVPKSQPTNLKFGAHPHPPPLIDWYSQSQPSTVCQTSSSIGSHHHHHHNKIFDKNLAGHIYSNTMYSFNPNPNSGQNFCPKIVSIPSHHPIETNSAMLQKNDANFSTLRSDCDSLVQIDGFQCRRNTGNDKSGVIERFL